MNFFPFCRLSTVLLFEITTIISFFSLLLCLLYRHQTFFLSAVLVAIQGRLRMAKSPAPGSSYEFHFFLRWLIWYWLLIKSLLSVRIWFVQLSCYIIQRFNIWVIAGFSAEDTFFVLGIFFFILIVLLGMSVSFFLCFMVYSLLYRVVVSFCS